MNTTNYETDRGQEFTPCGLLRRLAAIFYDGLLLLGIILLATLIVVIPSGTEVPAGSVFFQLYLLVISWLYFALGWRKGQTLGMSSWRIEIHTNGCLPSWTSTTARFAMAILSWLAVGVGFLWSLFNRDRATWHDLASDTRLRVRPKK
ncbi:MAG: RDD family protein [Pseudomonadota bacterium]